MVVTSLSTLSKQSGTGPYTEQSSQPELRGNITSSEFIFQDRDCHWVI